MVLGVLKVDLVLATLVPVLGPVLLVLEQAALL
ncbi:hypothetical protein PC120_g27215, partial [Phytophthora cactorum]